MRGNCKRVKTKMTMPRHEIMGLDVLNPSSGLTKHHSVKTTVQQRLHWRVTVAQKSSIHEFSVNSARYNSEDTITELKLKYLNQNLKSIFILPKMYH